MQMEVRFLVDISSSIESGRTIFATKNLVRAGQFNGEKKLTKNRYVCCINLLHLLHQVCFKKKPEIPNPFAYLVTRLKICLSLCTADQNAHHPGLCFCNVLATVAHVHSHVGFYQVARINTRPMAKLLLLCLSLVSHGECLYFVSAEDLRTRDILLLRPIVQ
jgi:hypothetical protein